MNGFARGFTDLPGITPARRAFLMGNALVTGLVTRLGQALLDAHTAVGRKKPVALPLSALADPAHVTDEVVKVSDSARSEFPHSGPATAGEAGQVCQKKPVSRCMATQGLLDPRVPHGSIVALFAPPILPMNQPHDTGYKLLFSDPLMVRDLVQGFIDEPWLRQLDFTTLERVNGQYVAEDMRKREDDVVWRVRSGEDWLYLYLLIEFQSTNDRFMALRMMVYVGLLYQDLIRQRQPGPNGLLPPVLPIVLYNGEAHWRAPTELSALLPRLPNFLAALQPQMRYLLIDESAYPEEVLSSQPQNLAAAIFRLEQPQTPEAVQAIVAELEAATRGEAYRTIRRLITLWLRAVLKRNRKYPIQLPELEDLEELRVMLSQRLEQWAEAYIATGREEGKLEGRLEGEARLLSRQLTRRFGELPSWVEERLKGATETQLADWSEAVLDARSLTEVFTEPPASH